MINFFNVKTLTRDDSTLPITVDDVKAYSQYFNYGELVDISLDTHILRRIKNVITNWESETGFLIYDQTFKTSLYNQVNLFQGFKARLTRLNVRAFGDILYYPENWNNTDAKSTLSTDNYYFIPERDTDPAVFQLKEDICYINLYPVYNNLEITITAGYEANDFTNMPQDIKDCLAMSVADIIDVERQICGCDGMNALEVQRIYRKYTAYTATLTL